MKSVGFNGTLTGTKMVRAGNLAGLDEFGASAKKFSLLKNSCYFWPSQRAVKIFLRLAKHNLRILHYSVLLETRMVGNYEKKKRHI